MGIIAQMAKSAGFGFVQKDNPNHGPDGKFTSPGYGGITSAGAAKDKSAYDAEKNQALVSYLQSSGFKANSANLDPSKGSVVYSKIQSLNEAGGGNIGHTNHTVVVHPDGSWEHYSEGTHDGSDLNNLVHVMGEHPHTGGFAVGSKL
jgi:hypothetical protein